MLGIIAYGINLAALTIFALRKPPLVLVGVLCMFGIEQLGQAYIPFLRTHGTFTNVYILLLVGIAVAVAYRSGHFAISLNLRHNKVRALSAALFLYALLSLTWAPGNPWRYWETTWPYLITNIILAPLLIADLRSLKDAQRAFLWLGGALVLFLATVPDWGPRSIRIEGGTEDLGLPLALAQMSGYLIIIGVLHFRRDYLSLGWLTAILVGALVVAVKTGSRGQLIFSIVSVVLVMPLLWRQFSLKNVVRLLVTGAVITSASVFLLYRTGAYSDRWETGEMMLDLQTRLGLANQVLAEWVRDPFTVLFGLGNSASFSEDFLGIYPHIVPLEVLGEEGIVGIALFTAVLFILIRQAARLASLQFLSTDVRRVYASTFGCLIFTLLLALKQGSLLTSSEIFLFAVLSEKYYYLIRKALYEEDRKFAEKRNSQRVTGLSANQESLK